MVRGLKGIHSLDPNLGANRTNIKQTNYEVMLRAAKQALGREVPQSQAHLQLVTSAVFFFFFPDKCEQRDLEGLGDFALLLLQL